MYIFMLLTLWDWQAVQATSFEIGILWAAKESCITSECLIINVFSFLLAKISLFIVIEAANNCVPHV